MGAGREEHVRGGAARTKGKEKDPGERNAILN